MKKFNKKGINTIDFIIEGILTNMSWIFYDCKSLIIIEFFSIYTLEINNMSWMFSECESLEYLDLSYFITSNIKDMKWMLYGCCKLKEIKGINNFNTFNGKYMSLMFSGCESLEYLDLSNFDTSNDENMIGMFSSCSKLKEIKGINNFKINKNCLIDGIFDGCDELDYLTISYNKICIDIQKLISKLAKNEKLISIIFFIPDKDIHYPIPYNESDSFSNIVNKLFEEFPELKSKNIYYLANGNAINKVATLKEIKIKQGDTILVQFIDDDN